MGVFDLEGNMQPVQSVAIIGAGNMGSGIAQKTAQEEFDVQIDIRVSLLLWNH